MIYTIGSLKLDVPETGPNRKARTPRQVVPWRDVAETCRTLDAICSHISSDDPLTICDGIARAGFWGKVFRNCWPDCSLHLNEEDESCRPSLEYNFPDDTITTNSIREWKPSKLFDVILLDFDHFTLNILDQWDDVLRKWNSLCRKFIIADGACYGFKFGNLRHYGVNTAQEYFYLLRDAMGEIIEDKNISVVSMFSNASTILLEPDPPDEIEFVDPTELYLARGGKAYKGGRTKPNRRGFGLANDS